MSGRVKTVVGKVRQKVPGQTGVGLPGAGLIGGGRPRLGGLKILAGAAVESERASSALSGVRGQGGKRREKKKKHHYGVHPCTQSPHTHSAAGCQLFAQVSGLPRLLKGEKKGGEGRGRDRQPGRARERKRKKEKKATAVCLSARSVARTAVAREPRQESIVVSSRRRRRRSQRHHSSRWKPGIFWGLASQPLQATWSAEYE